MTNKTNKAARKTATWTDDVLKVIKKLNKDDFTLRDVYGREQQLQGLHPHNKNVKAKIRQQLQALRDRGILQFVGAGRYRVIESTLKMAA